MTEGQQALVQQPATTIWNQLDVWAQEFKPWQRFVLANAVRLGRLTDAQVDQAYSLFLADNNLGTAPEPHIEVPLAITGRPASVAPRRIWLKRIADLCAINALPATAELTFSPTLTVVYGGNGVGKSGFTRILSNVCFSRTHNRILPNVYDELSQDEPAASIVLLTAQTMRRGSFLTAPRSMLNSRESPCSTRQWRTPIWLSKAPLGSSRPGLTCSQKWRAYTAKSPINLPRK